jgi:hypothetical protein
VPAGGFDPQREWLEATSPRGPGLALLIVVLALLFALGQCSTGPRESDGPARTDGEAASALGDIAGCGAGRLQLGVA